MRAFLRALTDQWQLKLLAFALAVLLWVVVSGEQLQSRTIPVPLDVRVTDPGYQLVEGSAPREVDVRFVGPGREFIEMMLRRPRLVVDVTEVQDTSEVIHLEPGMVQATGQNITARTVDPSRVRLRFQRRAARTVPVRIRLGPGYGRTWMLLDSIKAEPDSVVVTGPAALVARVGSVTTVPLRVGAGDTVIDRRIELDEAGLRGVALSAGEVRVRARTDLILERTVSGVPVSLGGALVVVPETVSVRLRGPLGVVQALAPSDLRVAVAIDSVPEVIPQEGIPVPLRAESPRAEVEAVPVPASARLLSREGATDTVPPRAEGGGR